MCVELNPHSHIIKRLFSRCVFILQVHVYPPYPYNLDSSLNHRRIELCGTVLKYRTEIYYS